MTVNKNPPSERYWPTGTMNESPVSSSVCVWWIWASTFPYSTRYNCNSGYHFFFKFQAKTQLYCGNKVWKIKKNLQPNRPSVLQVVTQNATFCLQGLTTKSLVLSISDLVACGRSSSFPDDMHGWLSSLVIRYGSAALGLPSLGPTAVKASVLAIQAGDRGGVITWLIFMYRQGQSTT